MTIATLPSRTPTATADDGTTRFLGLASVELRILVAVVALANALLPTIVTGIAQDGIVYAILNTFEVSAIVWAGLYIGVAFLAKAGDAPLRPLDKAVAAATLVACLLPLGLFTWCVLTLLALYLIWRAADPLAPLARAGWTLLAVTVPMFWSKRLFNLFADFFLSLDAMLVSSITGTERTANLVVMPGGGGVLQIAAPCSSMANVSLALLCWVLFTQTSSVRWRPKNVIWCAAACLAVVAINTTRITLIGYFPHYYEVLHGPVGNTVASWLSVFVVIGVCYMGVRRGHLHST